MSDDRSSRTVKPTPKRINDFRKQGKIALSRDLTSLAAMLGGGVAAIIVSGRSVTALGELTRAAMRAGDVGGHSLVSAAAATFVSCCLPVAIGAMAGCLVAGSLQLGWPPAIRWPSFDLGRPFTMQSIAQIISPKEATERAVKSTLKVGFTLGAMVLAMRTEYLRFLDEPALEPVALAARLGQAVARLGLYAVIALGALAAADYLFQRRKLMNQMMMTPEELKQEHKQQEGDPQLRGARRRKMRELSRRRLAADVKKADVVLVNPTHYAVALRYHTTKDRAPKVVAKGVGPVAERIRELARKAGVPILSRPPLTRLIYKLVPQGTEIPSALYKAVAEVLAYIYSLRAKRSSFPRGGGETLR